MKTRFSRTFMKQVGKLSGKNSQLFQAMIAEVEAASTIKEIPNCKKIQGHKNAYRIRMGDYRALFVFVIVNDVVYFQYLLPRGQAYNKEYLKNLL